MKKQLILVGGAMGVGKSAVCRELLRQLTPGRLAGRRLVLEHEPFCRFGRKQTDGAVQYHASAQSLSEQFELPLRAVLLGHGSAPPFRGRARPLRDIPFTLHSFSLVCTEQVLRERLERDVRDGIREADVIPRSLRRLPAYAALPTCKLDVTSLTPYEAACAIAASVGRASSRRVPGLSGAGESWHGA